jgi:hypothetical protein
MKNFNSMKITALLFFLFALFATQAQVLDLEKTYKVTSKSKKGVLAKVDFDNSKSIYTLVYVTKATDKLTQFQSYTFDKDFNFIDLKEEEIEAEKAKTKYKWFSFKGEEYSVEGLSVEPNLFGTLILKQKRITYKYDWFILGYYKDVDILKKVKPRTEDGRLFYYLNHVEDDKTGEVYVLCGVKDKMAKGADPYRQFKDLWVLKYNANLDLVKEVNIRFDFPQNVAFARSLTLATEDDPDSPTVKGVSLVFAPMGGMGMSKHADPDKNNYTYVRVDDALNVVDRLSFKSYASMWKIDELIHNLATDEVYLFGPSAMGKDKYFNELAGQTKFKAVQLMKIGGHKIDYFTETDLEEFKLKLKTPPSQRKSPDYEGKKFEIANYHIATNGDFLVAGQNFELSKIGNKYNDVLTFHFDAQGKLKAQYGIDTKESNQFSKANGTPQFYIENGNNMYWFLQEIKGVYASKGKVLSYPRVGKIDMAGGIIGNLSDYGGDGDYYLDPKFPYLQTNETNKVIFFGSDKKGKEIWFLRLKLD